MSSSTPPQRRWFTWREVSDISMSDDPNEDDDDEIPLVYSESEDDFHHSRGSPAPNIPRQQQHMYATGASAFRSRQESTSSRVVRFESAGDSAIGDVHDEETPPPPPDRPRHARGATAASHQDSMSTESSLVKPSTSSKRRKRRQPQSPSKMWNAVSNLAMAVHRSPGPTKATSRSSKRGSTTREYPHRVRTSVEGSSRTKSSAERETAAAETSSKPRERPNNTSGTATGTSRTGERAPLLQSRKSNHSNDDYGPFHRKDHAIQRISISSNNNDNHLKARKARKERKMLQVAASFLRDCERSRRPSLPADLPSITDTLLTMCRWKYSFVWCTLVNLALAALFLSCCYESNLSQWYSHALHIYAIVIFVLDMAMGSELRKNQQLQSQQDPLLHLRQSRLEQWTVLLGALIFLLTMEIALSVGTNRRVLWSSALKPIALFYVSNKAKNALEALNRISRIVARVLVMELFVILSFAAVACRLYITYDSFHDLSTAFLSLFQLSTTVVNPSVWMPMYSASRTSAFFFVFFVTISVFYLHSLVLSVVFQTYVQASADIHERSFTDREDAVRLAFLALNSIDESTDDEEEEPSAEMVRMDHVRKTLRILRPHYNAMKINALIEIVDPSEQTVIDYPAFRTKIRHALNASVRTARTPTAFSVAIELVAVFVAVVNFIYVILFTSAFHADWFDAVTVDAGAIITLMGLFELTIRLNPWHLLHFTPITRLNAIFDGLAAVAAAVSVHGLISYWTGHDTALQFLLVGRAIDMIRIMRFFPIFRDVVRRSGDVFPALAGPVALVVSSIHIFAYFGMVLWGGAVGVGLHADELTPLYDLNNFNSYSEGMVTMFQVLVVNDWHAIAEVFLYATRCSSPYIVYPFFVFGNLIGVSIMLNCLTAFFVGAFVTKRSDDVDVDSEEVTTVRNRQTDFGIQHSERNFRRTTSKGNLRAFDDDDDDRGDDGDLSTTSSDDLYEFDVYEREGYDKIMQTVAGIGGDGGDFAKEVCDFLEVFEGLSPGRRRVGFMVCCQQTMSRFGNRRFQTLARDYIDESALHMVVSDMHAELLVLSGKHSNRSLIRRFAHLSEPSKTLELTASLIRQHPAVSLFVSDVAIQDQDEA